MNKKNTGLLIMFVLGLLLIGGVLATVSRTDDNLMTQTPSGQVGVGGGQPTGVLNDAPSERDRMIDDKTMILIIDPVDFRRYNQYGTATLTETDGDVRVVVQLNELADIANPQPAHIHKGKCPGSGGIVYPLNDVVNGQSDTVIDTTLADLKSQLPLAINIHQSSDNLDIYTACGELHQ